MGKYYTYKTPKGTIEYTCKKCSKRIITTGYASRRPSYCPDCLYSQKRAQNKIQYAKDRISNPNPKTKTNTTTVVIVSHNDIDGFRPGATFSGKDFKGMMVRGEVEGARVKPIGKHDVIFKVYGRRLVVDK